jgi:Na+:H+ antiporter, NhaC family
MLAVLYQHDSLWQVLKFALLGFELDAETPIQSILLGGGIWSMAKVCLIVLISTTLSGILAGTRVLPELIRRWQSKPVQSTETPCKSSLPRSQNFLYTTCIGALAAAFGCTQTIGILLTEELVRPNYSSSEQLALDLENTVVVLAPLVPWNIAGLVPATILMNDWGFIPYAVYLYLIPALVLLQIQIKPSFVTLRRIK